MYFRRKTRVEVVPVVDLTTVQEVLFLYCQHCYDTGVGVTIRDLQQ